MNTKMDRSLKTTPSSGSRILPPSNVSLRHTITHQSTSANKLNLEQPRRSADRKADTSVKILSKYLPADENTHFKAAH